MSGIAGVLCLDGAPADLAALERMAAALRHRGPDRQGCRQDGPVAMSHGMLHTTSESLEERQPLVSDDGGLCLTLDGRVDNREALRSALLAGGARPRSDTDAELVLQAYAAWGVECADRILGDFAFAMWDRPRRRLFCARDPLGMKPLYYRQDGRTLRWASELHALIEDALAPLVPNEGMVAEHLAGLVTHHEETVWRGIRRVPPGHALVVDAGSIRVVRHWRVDPAREVRYGRDEEYAEHFLEILTAALRCRLRSHCPVGAHLSGGMDSSSLVALVQRLFRQGLAADLGFETFSFAYPGLPCDESPYIRAVVDAFGLKANVVDYVRPDPGYWTRQSRRYRDLTDFPDGGAGTAHLFALARERGMRVMLTGFGGNEWVEGTPVHLADLLTRFRLRALVRQARADMDFAGYPSLAATIWGGGLLPLVPPKARRVAGRLLGRNGVPCWIEPGFARATALADRIRSVEPDPPFRTHAQRAIYRVGTSGAQVYSTELCERSAAEHGIEERHPYHDRRLVEFMLAVPEEQRWHGPETKRTLRHAMRGLLPEAVRQRHVQADFSALYALSIEDLGGEDFFSRLAVAAAGWVKADEAQAMCRRMQALRALGDEAYIQEIWPLWAIASTELWYRANVCPADGDLARVHGG